MRTRGYDKVSWESAGLDKDLVDELARFTGEGPGGADSDEWAASTFKNSEMFRQYGVGPWNIHFPTRTGLAGSISRFQDDLENDVQQAGFTLHSIQDGVGAHYGYRAYPGHAGSNILDAVGLGTGVDRRLGGWKFIGAALTTLNTISGGTHGTLTAMQLKELIEEIVRSCKGKNAGKDFKFQISNVYDNDHDDSRRSFVQYESTWVWVHRWEVVTVTIIDDPENPDDPPAL